MNDLELVRRLDRRLVDDYQLARNYCLDVPTFALVHLRSIAHRLTSWLGERAELTFQSKNLYDRIEQLARSRTIDMRLARKLHKLRGDGNKGAHPEKYHLSLEQLVQLAAKSVKDTARLCAEVYPLLHPGEPTLEWQFEPVDVVAGRELCYRAVMEDDPEAQYLVGLSLKARALMHQERARSFAEANDGQALDLSDSRRVLEQAADWFRRAAPEHPAARFEHGVALLNGYGGERDPKQAVRLIEAAAEQGVADALALVGYFHLAGSQGYGQDPIKAERYLTEAADQDQPEAMANLGVLYYQGLLGAPDLARARSCSERAALAGYPHAQYHLAVMLFAGEGGEADPEAGLTWLQRSAEQHYPDALADLAQRTLDGDGVDANPGTAVALYREAIQYGRLPRAMFELALAHFDGEVPERDLVEAATLLHGAFLHAVPDSELADAIWQLTPELVAQLDQALANPQTPSEQAAVLAQVRDRFDDQGYPRESTA
ncbi:DUF4145 domain-containing protein [Ferrimonas balearica]|uniref:DUF4145 domain-containing protein n=1 Tax=Ferrimonas balearica TaxID=44012 RepID=UPI001C99EFA5|nr:DUF4145 domain-containing protein [Ferrimonas balearica]MBY5994140.1 SEL1-like repeat protein [Ferrimonas balearica]